MAATRATQRVEDMTKSRARMTALALVLPLMLAPALSGCSLNPIEGIIEQATGGDVSLGGANIPDGFPTDAVPLFDGEVKFGAGLANADGQVWNVTIAVPGADAYATIKTQLEDAGFTAAPGADATTGGVFSSDKFGVAVVVADSGDGGWVANYTVTPTATQ